VHDELVTVDAVRERHAALVLTVPKQMGGGRALAAEPAYDFIGLVDEREAPAVRLGLGARTEQDLRDGALSGRREDLGLRLGARVEAAESIGNPDPVDDAQDVIRYAIVELVMAPRAVAEPAAGVLVIHAYPERERGLHPVLGAAVDRESRVLRMVQLRGDQAASPEDARRESATELGGI